MNETLHEIDNTEKPSILVFNKIDAFAPKELDSDEGETINSIEILKKSWMAKMQKTKCVFISATEKDNIEELKSVIYEEVKSVFSIRYPYSNFLY